ncbi:hypothetical protein DFH08DRAFT_819907 [Mycena albidolilacea]|uniref:Uncharacterized protein n=1 Tax=Mycena albidolilacea TaxID=1033008 RepID=A0AAD6ZCZ3_9AGAR|nr:hypothetical protein DFH08DRAFT_819907 [Mycena albidolilacea]
MCSLCLVLTPELEAVLTENLGNLLKHELLADLLQPERHRWVVAVGSALFQLLAVQHMLGEKLSLNGSILKDLALGDVVPCPSDGPEDLAAIPSSAAHSGEWAAHMQQVNVAHLFYDPNFCPLIFRRLNGPQVETEPLARWMKKRFIAFFSRRKNLRRKPAGSMTKPVQVTKSKKKSIYPGYVEIDTHGNEL